MVRKILLSLMIVLLGGGSMAAFAQNKQISGTVSNADGNPIAGATILVEGTHTGTTSGADGKFAISAPINGALSVSFIGYQSQIISIAGKTHVNIALREDTQKIDDVVVTGYGVTRKAAFTGAASMVSNEIVNSKTDVNFMKSLQGAVAGLQMNNQTGMPGAYASVTIRGSGSINSGTEPLYVVDGVPMFSGKESMSEANEQIFSPLANINAADIESVTVLKDATATAIYGARAANGVIVITTKKGSGDALNVSFDMKLGSTSIAPYTDRLKLVNASQYMDIWAKGLVNKGFYTSQNGAQLPMPNYETAYEFVTDGWDGTNTDWMDAVTRSGFVQDYNLSVSGSSGKTNYYSSFGYMKNEGILIGTGVERYSGRINLNSSYKALSFGLNGSYAYSISDGIPTNSSYVNPIVTVYGAVTPDVSPYNPDGSYNLNAYFNPVAINDSKFGDIRRQRIATSNFNPYLAVNLYEGLTLKTSLGVNIHDLNEYQFWSQLNPQGVDYNGLGQQYNDTRTNITWTNTLSYNKTFSEKHDLSLMLGQEMQRQQDYFQFYAASDFPILGLRDMGTAGSQDQGASNGTSYARMASYFFNGEYSYDNRYYISGSFRRDGSSVFGSENLWGNFWSVGGKWRLTQESFLKDNSVLTNATIRASYGEVGNQDIGWYAARGLYELGYNYNSVPGMVPTQAPNEMLGWERSQKLNVGVDFSLINRVEFSIDAYREKTSDMIFEMPLSMTTGNASISRNIGSMKNTGIEFSVNATIMAKKNFTWTGYFNISHNKNEIIELSTDLPILTTLTIKEPGRSINQFYMPEWAGVDPETGSPLWYKGSEGKETTSRYNDAGKRYVGSSDPKVFGGFGMVFNFYGVDISGNFTYIAGNKVYVQSNSYDLQVGHDGFGNVTNYVYENAWTPENRNTNVPKFVYGDTSGANNPSTRFLSNGSFLRLKNLTIGYTLPSKWTQKAYMKKLRVYFTADNLWTAKADDFIGFDPETRSSGSQYWQYPLARTFTFGLSVGF